MPQLKIYENSTPFEKIPPGFQSVLISLDGTLKGDLKWKSQLEWASQCVQNGLSILWEVRLGLFDQLPLPLSNKTQFLSLGLSLEQFLQGPWKEFHEHSLGVCLYRGNADFSLNFPWEEAHQTQFSIWLKDLFADVDQLNQELGLNVQSIAEVKLQDSKILTSLYCRDIAADYLDLLAGHMSQMLPLYILLNASNIDDVFMHLQLLFKERFARFELGVTGSLIGTFSLAGNADGWLLSDERDERVAICLPDLKQTKPSVMRHLSAAIEKLHAGQIPFRVIFENNMTQEWDGLDALIVLPDTLSQEGKRKLMGFCAAGGQVVSLGRPLMVPEEVSFPVWMSNLEELV